MQSKSLYACKRKTYEIEIKPMIPSTVVGKMASDCLLELNYSIVYLNSYCTWKHLVAILPTRPWLKTAHSLSPFTVVWNVWHMTLNKLAQRQGSRLVFSGCSVRVSVGTPAILTVIFSNLPHSPQENIEIITVRLRWGRFLLNTFQFFNFHSYNFSIQENTEIMTTVRLRRGRFLPNTFRFFIIHS
jgi:hypothetical protein